MLGKLGKAPANISRRGVLIGVGSAIGVGGLSAPVVLAARRRNVQARRLFMTNQRTGEDLNIIYHIEGEYVPEALDVVNHFMRDWRADESHKIHERTLDILAAVHNILDTSEPYQLISGYRTPETNRMLQEGSGGVASNSLHVRGMAADVRLDSRSTGQLAGAALQCKAGGVGTYLGSGFVHVDCGRVRKW